MRVLSEAGPPFRRKTLHTCVYVLILCAVNYASASIRCASTRSAGDELYSIAQSSPDGLSGKPETGGYGSRYAGVAVPSSEAATTTTRAPPPPPSPIYEEDDDDDYRLYRKRPQKSKTRYDEEADFVPERRPSRYSSRYEDEDVQEYRRPQQTYRNYSAYEEEIDPYDYPRPTRPRRPYYPDPEDLYYPPPVSDPHYSPMEEPYYRPSREPYPPRDPHYRDSPYYRRPSKEKDAPRPSKLYERDKADETDDHRLTPAKPVYDEEGDQENCPIETRETASNHSDLPLTRASAIISTPIGDFIMYCAQEPAKAILTYPLYCSGYGDQSIGKEVLYTAIDHSCFDLRVVDDLTNLDKPVPMVVALSHGDYSTVYRVDYDMNQFRLQPCKHVIEHRYITDVAVMPIPDYGSLLAFSNNDPRPEVEYQEKLAPLFLAHAGEVSLCGYVDLQQTTDVAVTRRKNEIILAYLQRVGNTRRTIIYLNELIIRNGKCEVKPRRVQSTIGSAPYRGERNTLGAAEPFSIDQIICGGEDIQFLTAPQKTNALHLAIAIANNARQEHGVGCPEEEKVCPDGDRDKCFCGCVHANHRSVVLAYRPKTKMFDFLYNDETAMQELTGGPDSVVEITHLPTENCCLVFQTISPLGATELYTIEYDVTKKLRVYRFFKHGLPFYAEKSSFGYCTNNDLIISYSIHNYQSENSIYHLRCNRDKDRRRYLGSGENARYTAHSQQVFSGYRYPSSYYQDRQANRTMSYFRPVTYQEATRTPKAQQYRPTGTYQDAQSSNNNTLGAYGQQGGNGMQQQQQQNRTNTNGSNNNNRQNPSYQNQPVRPLYNQPLYNQANGYPAMGQQQQQQKPQQQQNNPQQQSQQSAQRPLDRLGYPL